VIIILESIKLLYAGAYLVLCRWLLDLSTPQKDLAWLQRQPFMFHVKRLKWYTGIEYFHQLKFRRMFL
jgi:hypothetical protein